MNSELITPKEAAAFLQISEAQLKAFRRGRTGPPFVRINSRVIRYRRGDLIAWIKERVEGGE